MVIAWKVPKNLTFCAKSPLFFQICSHITMSLCMPDWYWFPRTTSWCPHCSSGPWQEWLPQHYIWNVHKFSSQLSIQCHQLWGKVKTCQKWIPLSEVDDDRSGVSLHMHWLNWPLLPTVMFCLRSLSRWSPPSTTAVQAGPEILQSCAAQPLTRKGLSNQKPSPSSQGV